MTICRSSPIIADDADGLVRLFTETFEIPLACPMTDLGPCESACVRPLNLLLEFIRPNARNQARRRPGQPTRVFALGLEPVRPAAELVRQRDARGIAPGAPSRWPEWTWSNVVLPDFLPEHTVFFTDYEPATFTRFPEMRPPRLRETGGGPLGVERVREVVVGVPDPPAASAPWGRLLAPHPTPEPGGWALGAGPALRLEAAPAPAIARVVLQVRDRDRAGAVLRRQQLLGEHDGQRATLSPARLGSLQIELGAPPAPS